MKLTKEKLKRKLNGYFVRYTSKLSFYQYFYQAKWHAVLNRCSGADEPQPVQQYFTARPNPGAGIGHQLANWMAGYYYSKHFNLTFAHIPFPDPRWEDLLALGVAETQFEALLQTKSHKKVSLPKFKSPAEVEAIIRSYAGKKVIFVAERDQFLEELPLVQKDIQAKFHTRHPQPELTFEKETLNIALHIRRGDIVNNGQAIDHLSARFQAVDYFERILQQIIDVSQSNKIRVYLFSQGTKEEFKKLEVIHPLEYCLDMDPYQSFLHMAFANILVTSKSSFSYKPALLNRNLKIAPRDFWHSYPETDDWVLIDNQEMKLDHLRERIRTHIYNR
ncbi:hypothetical protein QEH59_15995 [Coraliomargarita sp. SDUM461004]|uniref:Alpha-1,2-fucosyltransferase n=1 Tax=Thalassobacterium sedimentorum TaxID=3041258 RepID=A0ABU1AMK7_9BACT|nr:hypothetical protein [Coraliomargarita sp. SDUM461004]MDQ8195937.1 hypothetical protein [Coraliomargarita sp. SDUM461004]